jgi:hypothetical protein
MNGFLQHLISINSIDMSSAAQKHMSKSAGGACDEAATASATAGCL